MMNGLRPKLAGLIGYMDEARSALMATAEQMNPCFASISPHDSVWSAEQNLAHLALVEQSVVSLMTTAIDEAREKAVTPDAGEESMLSSLDRFGLSEATHKVSAHPRVEPVADVEAGASIDALKQSRQILRELLVGSADVDLSPVTRPHRLLGELDLYQWALFLAQHEERHRRQIERTLAEATELASESAPIV